jgi:hypothetical protein
MIETLKKLRITGILLCMIVEALIERWRSSASGRTAVAAKVGRRRSSASAPSADNQKSARRRTCAAGALRRKKIVAGLTAFALYSASIFSPALETRALASQNSLLSPTSGTVSGLQLTNNYNNAIDSVNTSNSGASAPTNQLSGAPSLGNIWLNSTASPYPWQVYDGANWLTPFWIDATNHMTNVKIGGGAATAVSAATVDLCGAAVAPMAYITISGTTTVTSFGSTCKAGHVKIVTFSGVLTLTYNATSLIIPGAANVLTAAGDQAVVVSLGSGNWQVVSYTPANGAALINPAVDLGTYQLTSAVSPPSSKYLLAYGQPISRTTYASLMAVQTITQSVTRTNGSPTLTGFSDTTQIKTNAPVEGSGIPASTSITSCTSITCTMSANASSSGTANVQIFPNGNGDGSTTFNLPDCQGVTLVGRNNMSGTPSVVLSSTYFNNNPNALGASGGSQSHVNTLLETPGGITAANASQAITVATNDHFIPYNATIVSDPGTGGSGQHPATSTVGQQTSTGNNSISVAVNNTGAAGTGSGAAAAHPTVTPSRTANCMVRVLAMMAPASFPGSLAANDNGLPIVADRRRAVV